MRRRVMLLLGVLLLMGQAGATEVAMPAEAAYLKASQLLVSLGALPTFRDKELLLIKTDPRPVTLTPDQADCGKMFGIPYLKDRRTKTAAVYEVTVRAIDDARSDVAVRVIVQGYMDVNEGAPFFVEKTRDVTKVLTCRSKGHLESEFLDLLRQ